MSVIVTSRKFFDEFTGSGGGGTKVYPGRPGDKITVETEFYIKWGSENKRLQFISSTKTIKNVNDLDFTSFITDGELQEGDEITVVDTVSNNGDFTIVSISDREIILAEALTDEIVSSASIHGITQIKAIDYYSNIIPNSFTESYVSMVDRGTVQKYCAHDIDAEDSTEKNMNIATDSLGWVTDKLEIGEGSDEPSESEVIITGEGITDYKQMFKIVQTFIATPLFLKEQYPNFIQRLAPDYYQNEDALNHIVKINAKYNNDFPTADHTGNILIPLGLNQWFDKSANCGRAEYYIESIAYEDDTDSVAVDALDIKRKTNVTIRIKSRSGKFTEETKLILHHFICPLDDNYINTINTTLIQNFIYDRVLMDGESVETGGENEGTDYQVLSNIETEMIDANEYEITFFVQYTNFIFELLKAKDAQNRNYAFAVTTQDVAVATTEGIDRVVVLADFKNANYNTDNPELFAFVDYFHCHHFPNIDQDPKENFSLFEGEPAYIEIPFRIKGDTSAKDTILFSRVAALGAFQCKYTINGAFPVGDFTLTPGDDPTSEAAMQAYLDANYEGYICKVTNVLNDWIIIIFSPAPGSDNNGITTSFEVLGIRGATILGIFVAAYTDSSPTLKTVKVEIIATKEGKNNFVLEQQIFNTESIRKLNGAQDINLTGERGFKTFNDDLYNASDLLRNSDDDTEIYFSYLLRYGFVARYEYWREALPKDEGASIDVFKNVEEVTERWKNYSLDGWELKFKFTAVVIDTDGIETEFYNEVDISIKEIDSASAYNPVTSSVTQYFDEDLVAVSSVIIGGKTYIRTILEGDFSAPPEPDAFAYIFADFLNSAGITERRFSNTERESEVDSPFSVPTVPLAVDSSFSLGGVRISFSGTDKIIIDTIYNDSIDGWGQNNDILFYTKLGWYSRPESS